MGKALECLDGLEEAADKAGLREISLGRIDGQPLRVWESPPGPARPLIYFSAGIHGDEPAGVQALLELAAEGFFDDRAAWQICPLLNASGLRRGARENAEGVDLNRDYRFPRSREVALHRAWIDRQPPPALSLCLHEDWETAGFYLYMQGEAVAERVAHAILQAVAAVGPIETREEVDGFPIVDGLIKPRDTQPIAERKEWSEAVYLYERHPTPQFTFETPSSAALPLRVAMHKAAAEAAIDAICAASR